MFIIEKEIIGARDGYKNSGWKRWSVRHVASGLALVRDCTKKKYAKAVLDFALSAGLYDWSKVQPLPESPQDKDLNFYHAIQALKEGREFKLKGNT